MARSTQRRAPSDLGTVRLERSGRYRAYYRFNGELFNAPRTFETRPDALAWLAGERSDRRRGTYVDPRIGRDTLADYAATWLRSRPELAPRTRDQYEHSLSRWILPRIEGENGRGVELGAYPLADLSPAIVRSWRAAVLIAAGASARDRRTPKSRVHPARAWAASNGYAVKAQGLMPQAVLDAWRAAGSPEHPAPTGFESEHRDAGRTAAAHAYRLLHAILATALRDGLITANPCQISAAGVVAHRERTIASPSEVAALADAFPVNLSAAVTVAAWSGLRYGELFGLARKHVDLTAGTIRVERALVIRTGHAPMFGPTKTARSNRTVHLPAFVVDVLRSHLAHHVAAFPDALLFTVATTGNPVSSNYLSDRMAKARAQINRPELTWHDLRHTGATLAYQAGASVRDVQNRLGHTTQRAAAIYQHATDNSDQVLAERLDALHNPHRIAVG